MGLKDQINGWFSSDLHERINEKAAVSAMDDIIEKVERNQSEERSKVFVGDRQMAVITEARELIDLYAERQGFLKKLIDVIANPPLDTQSLRNTRDFLQGWGGRTAALVEALNSIVDGGLDRCL